MGARTRRWPQWREDVPRVRHGRRVRPAVHRLGTLLGGSLGLGDEVASGQRLLVAAQRLLGPDSRVVVTSLCRLAASLERDGRPEEAVVVLRSALARRPRALGADAVRRRRAEFDLGRLLVDAGADEEADAYLTRVVLEGLREASPGEAARDLTLSGLLWLAELRRREGRDGEARHLLERAATGLAEEYGPGDDDTLTAELSLAEVEGRTGDEERAVERLRRVAESFAARSGPDDEDALLARWHLAAILHRRGEDLEARVFAAGLLEAKRRLVGGGHEETVALAQLLSAIDETLEG